MALSNVKEWAQGKKSYITAGLGALGALAAYLTGDISLGNLITSLISAIGLSTLRSGMTTETDTKMAALKELQEKLAKASK